VSAEMVPAVQVHGLLAEFDGPERLLVAARAAREAGYRHVEAYSPFPVEGLAETLHPRPTHVPLLVLIGGILGGLSGYALQYYVAVLAYPMNVAGRPYNSIPSFVPVTFEMTILFAALFGFVGVLVANGLPRPYHPVFNVPEFVRASRDRFFLSIEARDPLFNPVLTRAFLERQGAREVSDVVA
jgi:Alternative complex III, ActD subunit